MTASIKWQAPPKPAAKKKTRPYTDWDSVLAEVKQRPGHWALVKEYKPAGKTYGSSAGDASLHKSHTTAKFIRRKQTAKGFEILARKTRAGNYGVFVKFTG